jgi:hypothetical protein
VSVLVEKMFSQLFNEDVERLVCCTLAMLVHILLKCLAGEGKEGLLSHPGGRSLVRLTCVVSGCQPGQEGVISPTAGPRRGEGQSWVSCVMG